MELYTVTKDKEGGISNDANDWSKNPHRIVDLLKCIIQSSLETIAIVNALPLLEEQQVYQEG